MDPLIEFSLPVRGMGNGLHRYDFQVDAAFFSHFETSMIDNGSFKVGVDIDKRVDMMTCLIRFEGWIETNCDRCLADIHLPMRGHGDLIFKFEEGADGQEDENDESVVYISPIAARLNVAPYIHEFITLALPMVRVYDCEAEEPRPCDMEMLAFLESGGSKPESRLQDGQEQPPRDNPFRDALKDLKS